MAETSKVVYIVVVDGDNNKRDTDKLDKGSFRYTRSVLQCTLQFMGCKARHAFKCILSSSADKTVRLWRVGSNECLQVFSHNNFVTRVQFNPVDENYFISGSVDGKVRSWSISGCKVVDWTEIKEIVTAVCYKPDGKV